MRLPDSAMKCRVDNDMTNVAALPLLVIGFDQEID